jgi:ketosteroid isomerase-like protein
VLISESTRRLVRELVTLEPFGVLALKGRAEGVTAYRVVSLERAPGVPATPFVGRDDELRRLMAVYETAAAERRARLAVILGSPGLGKSRLLVEVARRLGAGATVLTARCDAAGGATFAPLAEALRSALGLDHGAGRDAVRTAIAALFEQSTDATIESIYYVATGTHGSVRVGHTFGTNAEGGEFESVFVQLVRQRGERAVSAELFELDDLDDARARFEELSAEWISIRRGAP